MEYFKQSFQALEINDELFMNETIEFEANFVDKADLVQKLEESADFVRICPVDVRLTGVIGDDATSAQVDFANCDIGYGITGTQEEMLFGASPELCIAMLFCDTMAPNQAISIKGARKVAEFDGYGLNISLRSFAPIENQNWQERIIIAIDALDFSDEISEATTTTFFKQLESANLYRELIKACAGFSILTKESNNRTRKVSTGHWGCGAFCGHKDLKSIIQLIAAALNNIELIFYARDAEFAERFSSFLTDINHRSANALWQLLLSIKNKIIQHQNKHPADVLFFEYLRNELYSNSNSKTNNTTK
jgi:poly(ADP-ribose) glycohydrolase